MFKVLLLILAAFIGICLAQNADAAAPIPPKQDPWYTAPVGFESAEPGELLRVRAIPGLLAVMANVTVAAYQILYRTTDSQHKPTFAVTTLLVPQNPGGCSKGGTALLTYLVPYDTANLDYSPSHAIYQNAARRSINILEIEKALRHGWYVNVPDYEGPLASYTAGVISGYATIDSIRAVLAAELGLAESRFVKNALWGFSGGALAGEWAAELQPQYAPELKLHGAALGGLTPDILAVFDACSGKYCSYHIAHGVVGLSTQFPELEAYLRRRLKKSGPYNETYLFSVQSMTPVQAEIGFRNQNFSEYFIGGLDDIHQPEMLKVIESDGRMGLRNVPQAPLFVYQSEGDEISPIAKTDALVTKFCAAGASIEYERNTVGDHGRAFLNHHASAFDFLTKVLNGSHEPVAGCSIQNTTYNVMEPPFKRSEVLLRSMWRYML